jgi:single-strand DNA-binding protein
MSNEQLVTIVGRLTGDPEMRFTPQGLAVANFSVASNARKYDKTSNEWVDQTATYWRCSCWRDMAESVASSLTKGTAVVLQGELRSREWTDKEGGKRSSLEVDVQAIGPDLRWASATVVKAQRTGGVGLSTGGLPKVPAVDPWATGGHGPTDEVPF